MEYDLMIRIEGALISIALIVLFFVALYTYRVWADNQSIKKKIDLVYKKLQEIK
jgi:hypothetical protein